MKKEIFALVCALSMGLNAGLFSNDLEYYMNHPKEAKEKLKECEQRMIEALKSKDEEKVIEVQSDKECRYADKAYRKHKQELYRAKRKIEKEKRAKELEEKKKAFEAEYKKYLETFKSQEYKEFAKSKKECQYYSGAIFGEDYSKKGAKCKAWKELFKQKEAKAFDELFKKYPKDKLLEYKEKVCKNAPFGDETCDFAMKAFNKRKEIEIKNYLANKELLKKDFNECYKKIDNLAKKSKYNKVQKVKNSYKCYMAAQAAYKLNIYGYFKPMK